MGMFSRRSNQSSESDSSINYLASVSDLMASLLIVFLVAFTVINKLTLEDKQDIENVRHLKKELHQSQQEIRLLENHIDQLEKEKLAYQDAENQVKQKMDHLEALTETLTEVEKRLASNREAREVLLKRLQKEAHDRLNLEFKVDASQGVLTIPESEVAFETGKDVLSPETLEKLSRYGEIIAPILSCYVPESPDYYVGECLKLNPNHNSLEAIFIEGHTDNQRFSGDVTDKKNRDLSTRRSNNVFEALVISNNDLSNLKNEKKQALFSISGYGAERPVKGHEHTQPTNDVSNRRIEMRFIFTEPKISDKEKAMLDHR